MPLGIKPTVDFAFKKIFGSPQNSQALIGLLNAILQFPDPICEVELLNPFSYQEFANDKLIVLDVKCRDTAGHRLNVEMQVSVYLGLLERLVYYACSMYVEQLRRLLPGLEFEQAIQTIATISAKTEDRQMYDQREKAQRDYDWAMSGAREEGRLMGREEGREEGKLMGRIQELEELLGDPVTQDTEFQDQDVAELKSRLAALQLRLRDRLR